MEQILALIKDKFDEETLKKLSNQLGEQVENLRPAIESIIKQVTELVKGQMSGSGAMMNSLKSYLDKDGDGDIDLDDAMAVLNTVTGEGGNKITNIVNDLIGNKKQDMAASVSAENGISQSSASSLIDQIGAMVTEGIRKLKQEGGFNFDGILDMLDGNNVSANSSGGGNVLQMLIAFIRKLLGSTKR